MAGESNHRADTVGPVLAASETARAVVDAIQQLNRGAVVQDRGSYLRILVPRRCVVTREAIEAILGRPFALPSELERMMPSFRGRLVLTEDAAVWTATAMA